MSQTKVLLLDGGMRKNGTSSSLAKTIKRQVENKGQTAEITRLVEYFDGKHMISELKTILNKSDIIGIIAPCYVNTFPYADIWCLEQLICGYQKEWQGKMLFAVAQGGMPDLKVHQSILHVSEHFAEETEMKWAGGLIIGMAPLIDGAPLENCGFIGRRLVKNMDRMVDRLLDFGHIPSALQNKITIDIPKILNYPLAFFLNYIVKSSLKKGGAGDPYHKPYCS